jgi:predicted transcriptional regulator of viral defense system
MPRDVWIAMPRGSHAPRIDYPPLRLIQFSAQTYSAGIETHQRDGVALRVYGVAKTVADCFRHRNKVGLDVALEALREVQDRRLATADDIWKFALVGRVTNVMRPYLEAMA